MHGGVVWVWLWPVGASRGTVSLVQAAGRSLPSFQRSMDDAVLAQFQTSFLVEKGAVNDTRSPHPHYSLYKSKGEGYASQEARRKRFLEEQQNRRRNFADHARKIAEGSELSDDSDGEMDEGLGVDEVDASGKKDSAKQRRRRRRDRYPYRNQLMLSEWLVDVPSDFEQNWLVVVVPVGRRSLIVSARQTTTAYSRAGDMLRNFPSLLPGGCHRSHRSARDYSILDCVFYEGSQTYYILDVMCWGGHPVYDSDLEFRTYWKEQKCDEYRQIATYSRINPLPFHDLKYHPCTRESLTAILAEEPPFEVDGLLFIHKECRYIIGHSPLALWLKAHMVTDILGIPVSPEFLAKSPTFLPSRREREGRMDTGDSKQVKGRAGESKMEDDETEGGVGAGDSAEGKREESIQESDGRTAGEEVNRPSVMDT